LSASGATGTDTYHWYTAATGGASINTGATYSPSLSATTTYYVSAVTTAGCESASRVQVVGTINSVPTETITTTGASNCGTGTVTLSASGATGTDTYHWYTAATGGASINTGATYSPSLSATTTYYVSAVTTAGCESASRVQVVGTINSVPTETITTTGASNCGTGTVTLSASGATGTDTYHWYTAATGGSSINTGATYSPTLSATTTYYVSAVTTAGCESASRVQVVGTINSIPTETITTT